MGVIVNTIKFWFGIEVAKLLIGLASLLCLGGFVVGMKLYNKSKVAGSRVAQAADRSAGMTLMIITGIPLAIVLFVEILPYLIFGAILESFQ